MQLLDPQLHTHFVVANATWDEKKKCWKSLDPHDIFKAIRYAGKVYQNELALECRRLGYEIEAARNEKSRIEGFEIKGVSQEIREKFSKRRAEVEAGIERFQLEKGRPPTTKEIDVITRETRGQKMVKISTAEVRKNQRTQLPEKELSTLTDIKNCSVKVAVERKKNGAALRMEPVKESLQKATEHIFERESAVSGHKIMSETLNQAIGYTDLDRLQRHMSAEDNGIIQLTPDEKNPLHSSFWSSVRGLRLERESVAFVNQTQRRCNPLGVTENVDFDFKSSEQQRVVIETLNNTDRVYAIRGRAGTGKTTALKEIRKGLDAANRNGIYLAPTSAAVKVLKNDGFDNATTVDSFLARKNKQLGHNDIIIIDEASLLSTEKGAAVLKAAKNARVLFVGDTHQHVSVEAGDFLRVLEQHSQLRFSELKDIIRQQHEDYNFAVRALAEKRTVYGMKQIDELGWIHGAGREYIEKAANAYLADTDDGTKLDKCIAVSPTWAENYIFTDSIRQKLKDRRLLDSTGAKITVYDKLDWTKQQMKIADNYKPGMLITFSSDRKESITGGKTFEIARIESGKLWLKGYGRPIEPEKHAKKIFSVSVPRTIELTEGDKILLRKNEKKQGLTNGDILTVDKINDDGSIETRTDKINPDGTITTVKGPDIPPDYRHFCHGYVVTSHKSQGATKINTVIAAESLDTKSSYVSFSRSRQKATMFTPDKTSLFDKLGIPTDRLSAIDALNTVRTGFAESEIMSIARLIQREELYMRNIGLTQDISNYFDKEPEIGRQRQNHEML